MNETCELICRQLWSRGWTVTWTYDGGDNAYECRLLWRHVERSKNSVIGSGPSLLLALEHARDALAARERDK
jgi:hypothetical protein